MAQRRSLGILPRGLDKRTRLSEQEGDQNRATVPPPLPLGESWGEDIFAFTSKASDHPALGAMTNLLIQHRFPLNPSSQLARLPLKIAKRQSISRESAMTAIVAFS